MSFANFGQPVDWVWAVAKFFSMGVKVLLC